ncbi:hypothetical protein [Kytococcus sedentarius]|uniref:hypothetical protein n=1 Tax=Kytococcus sedentarius TaxID=1276 RepID=UPI0035BC87AC
MFVETITALYDVAMAGAHFANTSIELIAPVANTSIELVAPVANTSIELGAPVANTSIELVDRLVD